MDLIPMNNYVKTLVRRMAFITGTKLTNDHNRILEYTFDYYRRHKVGPMYYNIKKNLGYSKDDIQKLFPHGLKSVYTWVDIPIQTPDQSCKPFPTIKVTDFRSVYLDHNATTYVRPSILKMLNDYYAGKLGYGNPSSSTEPGREAYEIIEEARRQIAFCLGVHSSEIVFTGSGSEANNLAIKGIAFKHFEHKGHIITSKIEHSSVLKTVRYLESLGFETTFLDVTKHGRIVPEDLEKALQENTILVALMVANNEIGTINPMKEIGNICRNYNVPLLMDGIQAFGRIPLHPAEFGISMMSLSGHKVYAPKGVGALYVSKDIELVPLVHGGGQEMGLRAGTENVGHIMAFGSAARMICKDMEKENQRLLELRDFFLDGIRKIEPNIVINGDLENRLPNNLSIGFPGVDSGALLLSLNQVGIYTSSGSACSSGNAKSSHVLEAIDVDPREYGTLRFSMGLLTTQQDLEYVLNYLAKILASLKS